MRGAMPRRPAVAALAVVAWALAPIARAAVVSPRAAAQGGRRHEGALEVAAPRPSEQQLLEKARAPQSIVAADPPAPAPAADAGHSDESAPLSIRLGGPMVSYLSIAAGDATTDGVLLVLVSVAIYLGFVLMAARYYLSQREASYSVPLEGRRAPEDFKEFRASCLACAERPDICLWAVCCPWVRWADSLWTMGVFHSFWLPMVLFLVLCSLGSSAFVLLLALVGAMYRQILRQKFDMERQGGATLVEDFCLYCWCMCCAVAQEARQVEEAVRADHPAVVQKAAAAGEP